MKIAIKGHLERSKEVIDTLINLGGINKHDYKGINSNICYYINKFKHIEGQFISKIDKNFYKLYTLEEFEKLNKMETRNITLTIDKAKEWYNKGGELKEIALQAYTKEELNPFPKSWEEYIKRYGIPDLRCVFSGNCPRKYIALWKLEQLRDCYRQGWKPDWTKNVPIDSIYTDKIISTTKLFSKHFLSFQSEEVAKEFKKNFESLIREAEEFI